MRHGDRHAKGCFRLAMSNPDRQQKGGPKAALSAKSR